MADPTGPEGATPTGPDPATGAMPAGTQQTGSGATPEPANHSTTLGEPGRAALDAERDARRDAERRVAEQRDRIAQLEDAGKSGEELARARLQRAEHDLEQTRNRVVQLERELTQRDLDTLRTRIATEEGVGEFADLVQGDDTRSIRDAAKKIAARVEASRQGSLGIGTGGTAGGRARAQDMNTLIRQAAGRE